MENNSNFKLITDEEEIVLANNGYDVSLASVDYSEDVEMPFGFWVQGQYGHASRKYYFTANAPGAHMNGGAGKYIITVRGSEEVTLHLYNSCTCDEIYTRTGKSFEATDIPYLEYNGNYHFLFTKAMDSCDFFDVRVDYRTQTTVDDEDSDDCNEDCEGNFNDSNCDDEYNDSNCDDENNCEIPVEYITMCYDTLTMNVGQTSYLCYEIFPMNASNTSIVWESSNSNIVEIDSSTGVFTTKLAGSAVITATTVDGGFSANCMVMVIDPHSIEYVNITKDSSGVYSVLLTKFYNGDFYFQAYCEESDEWGELYSLSQTNIDWLNDTYNSYYDTYISQGHSNTNLIGHRVYLAKNKLINTINAKTWDIVINSDEFYGMWMHYTRFESAYADATLLLAEMVETASIIISTIYQAVVTIKAIATLANARKTITSSGYKSMTSAYESFSNITDSQAISEGITDTTTYSGERRTWLGSEIRVAEDLSLDSGFNYNKSYKVIDGKLTQVPHGTAGSQRPDFYNPITNQIVEVKNYTITTQNGRNNLANNIVTQYNNRKTMFSNVRIEFKIDVYGQEYTQDMLNNIRELVKSLTGNENLVSFIFD